MKKEFEIFHYNFPIVALIAFLNCPDRSDYNLPLAIFAYLLWDFKPYFQKHRILWIILISVICDIIWVIGVSIIGWG
jgi:hypothetical protein